MIKAAAGSNIAIIGCGAMGEALIAGIVSGGGVAPDSIFASDSLAERSEVIRKQYGVRTGTDNVMAATSADVVVLAVKPSRINDVLAEVQVAITGSTLVISVAAGITIGQLAEGLPAGAKIIRVMPNMPALVREGMSVLVLGPGLSDRDLEVAQGIFCAVGKTLVVEEQMIDAVTGVSGSGPAYVLLLIEALADGGVRMGLPRDIALTLATQTVRGTAHLQQQTGEHPARLKDRITSPGGTTIAGLHVLEKGGFRGMVSAAVERATKRAVELRSE